MNGIALLLPVFASFCNVATAFYRDEPEAVCVDSVSRQIKTSIGMGVSDNDRTVILKTDALPWCAGIINIEGELRLGQQMSVALPLWWSPYFILNKFSIRTFSLQPEVRYWLAQTGSGHFLGVHAGVSWFNVKIGSHRYQDNKLPLLNCGVSYGYAFSFDDRWGMELSVGAGYASIRYDRFYNIKNGAKIDTRRTSYWGIDNVSVSFTYRFAWRQWGK